MKHVEEAEETIEHAHMIDSILQYPLVNVWFGFGHKP
jgi:hypothetical protein